MGENSMDQGKTCFFRRLLATSCPKRREPLSAASSSFQYGSETNLQITLYADMGGNHCVDDYLRTPFGNALRSDGSGINHCIKPYQEIPFGNALSSDALGRNNFVKRYSARYCTVRVEEHHGLRQGMLVHRISIRPTSCKQRQVPH